MNILLTSAGRRGYLVKYFREALNGDGFVHVGNSSPVSPAFAYADYHIVTPLIYDENYIPFLLNYCKEYDIKAIISLFDIDLYVLSCHKKEFKDNGIEVIVSDPYNVPLVKTQMKKIIVTAKTLYSHPKNVSKIYAALHTDLAW